jgi:hypothetical protein
MISVAQSQINYDVETDVSGHGFLMECFCQAYMFVTFFLFSLGEGGEEGGLEWNRMRHY